MIDLFNEIVQELSVGIARLVAIILVYLLTGVSAWLVINGFQNVQLYSPSGE